MLSRERRILIVDDEREVRSTMQIFLEKPGRVVDEACDGFEALKMLANSPPYDIAFIDLNMPKMDGQEVMKIAREQGIETIFIVITGYATLEAAVISLRNHAADFLIKPFQLRYLDTLLTKTTDQLASIEEQKIARTEHKALVDHVAEVSFRVDEHLRLYEFHGNGTGYCYEEIFGLEEPCSGCPMQAGQLHETTWTMVDGAETVFIPLAENPLLYSEIRLKSRGDAVPHLDMDHLNAMSLGVAHELKNPLSVISSSSYFLSQAIGKDLEKSRKHVDIILQEVKRAEQVINELIEFTRNDQGVLEPFSPRDVLRDMLETLKAFFLTNDILVETELDAGKLALDQTAFKRILMNVVVNAVESMSNGGTLKVRAKKSGKAFKFEVSDTGIGMTPSQIQTCKTPFFSSKGDGHHSGIGLWLTHQFVHRFHGEMDIVSQVDKGTTISITLPLH